jgi:hypothetical protein
MRIFGFPAAGKFLKAPFLSFMLAFILTSRALSASDIEAQSVFRFNPNPEFMYLRVYPDNQMAGYTASLWQKGYISSVFGRVLKKGTIELSFFPAAARALATKTAQEKNSFGRCPSWVENGCDLTVILQTLSDMGVRPDQRTKYVYDAKRELWIAVETTGRSHYSNFKTEKDYEPRGVVAQVLQDPQINPRSPYELTAAGALFDRDIVHSIAGLPVGRDIAFKTRYCDQIGEGLNTLLTGAGHWDVDVSPETEKTFLVKLKSHSGREFFYKDGYWWKAFVEIQFTDDDGNGKCSHARVYLYDSAVCGGPPNDDPDKNGRTACYRRIEPDSKAEVDLRDHLTQILQKSYGVPQAN